eukprot:2006074-Pleurochrysis_carterae.AAC.1
MWGTRGARTWKAYAQAGANRPPFEARQGHAWRAQATRGGGKDREPRVRPATARPRGVGEEGTRASGLRARHDKAGNDVRTAWQARQAEGRARAARALARRADLLGAAV